MRFPLVRPFAVAALLALAAGAQAQEKIELKLAYFVGDQHAMSQWLIKWSEGLEKGSNGRIVVKRFPGAQMGPTPQHYDFARTGQADVVWFLHGVTPGRFNARRDQQPAVSGRQRRDRHQDGERRGAARSKYLDAEHKGVKVLMLFTNQPGGPHTTKKAIRTMDDFKGLRLRFASPTIRDLVQGLGATPVGVPPTEVGEHAAEGDDRRHLHGLRRRRDRVQARRHDQVLDRAVRLYLELRPGDERGVLEQAAAGSEEARHGQR